MQSSLISFLAPAAAPVRPGGHSVETSPPAVAGPVAAPRRGRAKALRFGLAVVGNAFGFAVLFSGCWLALQILAAFV